MSDSEPRLRIVPDDADPNEGYTELSMPQSTVHPWAHSFDVLAGIVQERKIAKALAYRSLSQAPAQPIQRASVAWQLDSAGIIQVDFKRAPPEDTGA